MLGLTREEKLAWGEKLRTPSNLPFPMPEGYMNVLNEVDTKEILIAGSEGQDIKTYFITTSDRQPDSVLYINIHGGGFVQKHAIYDQALCAIMARDLKCAVLDIDYRLAPEYPYPAGLNDCYNAVLWAYDHAAELGIDKDKVVIGGNSAGGTFSAAVCMRLARENKKIPELLVMVYPACDTCSPDGLDTSKELDLRDQDIRSILYYNLYLDTDDQLTDPYVSLVNATPDMLTEMPDTVIVTAGLDPLREGGEQFAKNLAVSGSRIVLQRFRKSNHGFYLRCIGEEWQAARNLVFDEIRRKMGM